MSTKKREFRPRLSIEIPAELHKEIKLAATNNYCTITNYVLRAILEKIKIDKQYQ